MKRLSILLLLALAACSGHKDGALPVMSFNVRLGVADDGENSWDFRRDAACAMIKEQHPAVFGVQEAYDFQLSYIQEHCPE